MRYCGIDVNWFNTHGPIVEADDSTIGSWTRLSVFVSGAETGEGGGSVGVGRIIGCKQWSTKAWLRSVGTDRKAVNKVVSAGLARWDGDDLLVDGYDLKGQNSTQSKRSNGMSGGRPKKPKSHESETEPKPIGYESNNLSAQKTETEAKANQNPSPFLSSPNLSLPSHKPPNPQNLDPDETLGYLPDRVAEIYRDVSSNTDLGEISASWTQRQRDAIREMSTWCGGDLAKLRTELELLRNDSWLASQPVHIWASRIGTGDSVSRNGRKRAMSAPTAAEFDTSGAGIFDDDEPPTGAAS